MKACPFAGFFTTINQVNIINYRNTNVLAIKNEALKAEKAVC